MTKPRRILIAVIVPWIVGCGASPANDSRPQASEPAPAGWAVHANRDWGYSVAYPSHWQSVAQPRTPEAGDPEVILSIATFPLSPEDAPYPWPRQGFDSTQAFVTISERGLDASSTWHDFPLRPPHFKYEPGEEWAPASYIRSDELRFTDHWFRFTDANRHFHALVVVGKSAPQEAATEAYRILDTLLFDPDVKPDWEASP
jgi:hypothetical protein